MLLPQFTTRRLLAIISACAVFFLVLSMAVQGRTWAIAVSIVGGAALLTLVLFALLFQMAYVLAQLMGTVRKPQRPQSPFAQHTPPPRHISPEGLP
jgi:hypothetical protein